MVKRWIRAFIVLIFFNILLAQVNESLESEMRKKYSFTYFGEDTEETEGTETDNDVQTEKYQQIDRNLLGDFLEGVNRRFVQEAVSRHFMIYNEGKSSFSPVVDESSSFPQELVVALEEALYQCNCRKPETADFSRETEDYESLMELGFYDVCVDLETIDVLFPKIAAFTRHSDLDEKYDYLRDFYGIPDNCRNIFHVAGDKDKYIFVYYPDDGIIEKRIAVRLTERTGDEFAVINEFELMLEEMYKSDCGAIQYGEEIYFFYFQYNDEEREFDSIKVHRMSDEPEKDTLEIKYLPEEYIWDVVYYNWDDDIPMELWDQTRSSLEAMISWDKYLGRGMEEETVIYYGDGEEVVHENTDQLGDTVYKANIANLNLPVYIQKEYVMPSDGSSQYFQISFYYYDSQKKSYEKLSNLSVDNRSQEDLRLEQLWFENIDNMTYAFRLYHVSEYNYLLNILLLQGSNVTMIETYALSPMRKFVLTEGGAKEVESPAEFRVLEEDTYYKIVDRGYYNYYYAIYNSKGEVVYEEEYNRQPRIEYIDDTVIRIQVSMGTNALSAIYYDTLNDRLSEGFFNPLTEEYGKVAYLTWQEGEAVLAVQDIFDKKSYYEEISLDFSPVVDAVNYAEFMDENRLYISYLTGESMEKKAEILELGR